jgi:hypothetical protein
MKKAILLFVAISFSTLIASANNEINNEQKPAKSKEEKITFGLASGYFSFFDWFVLPTSTSDSTKVKSPASAPKKEESKTSTE